MDHMTTCDVKVAACQDRTTENAERVNKSLFSDTLARCRVYSLFLPSGRKKLIDAALSLQLYKY